ncbi:MAG: membrane protein insertion efficiency factor YidD [Acidimicrobiales bacterium]|nr:membrane protein insertion efficiency factor YidD [Acidimicrobiales bacterium]
MFKQNNTLKNTAQVLILGYQRIFAFREPTCRYLPSCSEYANDAIENYGALKGTWLSFKRLLRCHPFGNHGYDPVPPKV